MKGLRVFCAIALFLQVVASQSDDELDEVIEDLIRTLVQEKQNENVECLQRAWKSTEKEIKREEYLKETVKPDGITKRLNSFLRTTPHAKRVGLSAQIQMKAMQEYKTNTWDKKRQVGATTEDFLRDVTEFFGGSLLKQPASMRAFPEIPSDSDILYCTKPVPTADACNTNKNAAENQFRTFDGSCNNLDSTEKFVWGSSNRAQIRLQDSSYGDALGSIIRKAKDGSELPSARTVSKRLLSPNGAAGQQSAANETCPQSPRAAYIGMIFGQFLDHDITHTPSADVTCTGCETLGECLPIPTPDEAFRDPNRCIPFKRSQIFLKDGCPPAVRTFANTITAWVDASNVYGSTEAEAKALYDSNTGKMHTEDKYTKTKTPKLKPFLPYEDDPTAAACEFNDPSVMKCFKAGDVRQNENIGLTAMHTLFMRYHNHVVDKLEEAAGGFKGDGEKLFQTARRIVGGVWQHLVYDEYLPVILGRNSSVAEMFNLIAAENTGYDVNVNPDIATAFSTAAFRFGHTEINDMMKFAKSLQDDAQSSVELHNVFFNPSYIYEPTVGTSGIDSVIMGLIKSNIGDWDNFFAKQICENLFQTSSASYGLDLPALNVQRGRDHGLQPYIKWRKYCGLDNGDITSWDQLRDVSNGRLSGEKFDELKGVYSSVEDIDLFPAAMMERRAEGTRVGPTFACIIADQFRRLKLGDRFFYDNENGVFNKEQVKEIKKMSLSRILCDTLDSPGKLPKQVLVTRDQDKTFACVEKKGKGKGKMKKSGSKEKGKKSGIIGDMNYKKFV